jgi:hypothetical protein
MAKVLGQAARYVSQEETKSLHCVWRIGIISMGVTGAILGFMVRALFPFPALPSLAGMLLSLVAVLLVCLVGTTAFRRLDELEKRRNNMRKGGAGERTVESILAELPDEFCVLNDVAVGWGNLDHIVVGPTGVFVIETKNWRGVVGANGAGELTLNGEPTHVDEVKRFVSRMMEVLDKVKVLVPGDPPFFKALMVFTAAKVNARFGTTGNAYCIRDDQLAKHIVDHSSHQELSPARVMLIAQALAGIAMTVPEFRDQAKPLKQPGKCATASVGV